jgi:hypothetical protein
MHLTNYAINKNSEDFVRDDDEAGSKRFVDTKSSLYVWNKKRGAIFGPVEPFYKVLMGD